MARWTLGRLASPDERLEFLLACEAGVFVQGHRSQSLPEQDPAITSCTAGVSLGIAEPDVKGNVVEGFSIDLHIGVDEVVERRSLLRGLQRDVPSLRE